MNVRTAFKHPIYAQPIRSFPDLEKAVKYVKIRQKVSKNGYFFNIQQNAENRWTVSRVVGA